MPYTPLTERNTRDFIERKPQKNTIIFKDVPLNITGLSIQTRINLSTLSRLFSGQRTPTLRQAELISNTLRMGLEEFIYDLRKIAQNRQKHEKQTKVA